LKSDSSEQKVAEETIRTPLPLSVSQRQALLDSIQVIGLSTDEDNLERIFEQLKCDFEANERRVLADTINFTLLMGDYSELICPQKYRGRIDINAFTER
jgi:hypothetical protein